MKMVTGAGQVNIDFTTAKSSETDGNNISLNPSQINKLVAGASSDLNSETTSYGMVALHEFNHTTVGGGFEHSEITMSILGAIDQPDVIGNSIRSEMSAATGTNWGQRESYASISINGTSYLPYSSASLFKLQQAKAYEGTLKGFLYHAPPTTSVVATNE